MRTAVAGLSGKVGFATLRLHTIIPARIGSSRFPGKPLAKIGTKPMIQHVYESAVKADLDRVVVATDDRRIMRTVQGFGGEALLTSNKHTSGTDRLAEVAQDLRARWIINVQGDLPFVHASTIRRSLEPLMRDTEIPMGTAATPIVTKREFVNRNVVKVVTDSQGFAAYFSRAPIPYHREGPSVAQRGAIQWGKRHLGIYVYQREFLLRFARLTPAPLEEIEGLEQLRALHHGFRISVADVEEPSIEVDTPEDLANAQRYWTRLRTKDQHG
jgi:3-deoxy-manno-octulosonate cytidylyltransferase (CMP-KDO synthetase)